MGQIKGIIFHYFKTPSSSPLVLSKIQVLQNCYLENPLDSLENVIYV